MKQDYPFLRETVPSLYFVYVSPGSVPYYLSTICLVWRSAFKAYHTMDLGEFYQIVLHLLLASMEADLSDKLYTARRSSAISHPSYFRALE